jgi:hypothetical protein
MEFDEVLVRRAAVLEPLHEPELAHPRRLLAAVEDDVEPHRRRGS